MKKKQLITSLAATSIMMSSMVGNVFADSSVADNSVTDSTVSDNSRLIHIPEVITPDTISSHKDIMTITPSGFIDKFRVQVNKIGESKSNEYTSFEIRPVLTRNRIDFTVITEKGTTLGDLENSQRILDNKEDLENGRVKYTFHYTLFNYSPERVININVTPVEETVVAENPVPSAEQTVVAENSTPSVDQNVVEESTAPSVNQTIVEESSASSVDQTVVEEISAPSVDQTVVEEISAPSVDQTVVEEISAPSVNQTIVEENLAPSVEQTVVEESVASSVDSVQEISQ